MFPKKGFRSEMLIDVIRKHNHRPIIRVCYPTIIASLFLVYSLILFSYNVPRRALLWIKTHTPMYEAQPSQIQTQIEQLKFDTTLHNNSSVFMNGPLRVDPDNPRYFTDGNGKAILLTGSHTWSDLQDNGGSDPPPAFDYTTYLDFLQANNHNFFRLWVWEESRWTSETTDDNYWFYPMTPFQRTGPEYAEDGKLKFNLTFFNQDYFDRMRARIIEAGDRGIYVSIMLFNGWSLANKGGQGNPWRGHPFKSSNNINGIDGDPNGTNYGESTQDLSIPAITAIQEAYVRKVIDTVNDLDNVLYEISNESTGGEANLAWQYHFINYIHDYEADMLKQHPVGITVPYPNGNNDDLFASNAEWISPNGGLDNPPPTDGTKVVLADTDHLCGICGDRVWAWKSFTRGENPLFMDGYDGAGYGVGGDGFIFNDPTWVSLRRNLGYIRSFANRINLEKMVPHGELASSGYALAYPSAENEEYLVYLPSGGSVTVDLSASPGNLNVEWFNPDTGETTAGDSIIGGDIITLNAPFPGDVVLYINKITSSLIVYKAGNGFGTVTSLPSGIDCGDICSADFDYGTVVNLSAEPGVASTFAGWGGGCAGKETCTLTMTETKTVTATFALNTYILMVFKDGNGSGTVISSPPGINCGDTCSTNFDYGTEITLFIEPGIESTFGGWDGSCAGEDTCTFTMTETNYVTATFTLNTYIMTVSKAGNGTGTVTSSPPGINCGDTCSTDFDFDTIVTLSAEPGIESTFAGWSGPCIGVGNCTTIMTEARSVMATFTLNTHFNTYLPVMCSLK